MKKTFVRKFKTLVDQFFLIDDAPHKVAAGAAVGLFFGILPGLGLLSALLAAYLLKINRFSATLGALASNFWLTIIFYPLAASVGGFMFEISPEQFKDQLSFSNFNFTDFFHEFFASGIALPFLIGFVVVDIIVSLSFYVLLYLLLKNKKLTIK